MDHGVNVGDDVVDRDPHDAMAECRQRLVAPPGSELWIAKQSRKRRRCRVLLCEVHATVDFDDEPNRRSQEVDDERPKDDLPTKPDAELPTP